MKKIILLIGAIVLSVGIWVMFRSGDPAAETLETPPLRLHQGIIIGTIDPGNPDIQIFNGIPYATSTRWTAPSEPPQWGAEPRQAKEYGDRCMQAEERLTRFQSTLAERSGLSWLERTTRKWAGRSVIYPNISEDCLFLNVRSTNIGQSDLMPVMVWLHGGSHQFGAGSNAMYQSNAIVENGAMYVSINYRLGAFGYLAHPALTEEAGTSGNYGLQDQIAALEWVRDNASLFGGDPNNVTVFGESAGAQSITELMAAPLADGLYHKVILQSGASTFNANHLSKPAINGGPSAEDIGAQFLEELASPEATVEAMRAIPASAIITHAEKRTDLARYFLPIIDDHIIPEMIAKRIRDGGTPRVPMIVGFNADEGSIFYNRFLSPTSLHPPITGALEDHEAALESVYGHNSARALAALYGMQSPERWDTGAEAMLGDEMFGAPSRFMARHNSRAGQPTWTYVFTRVVPGSRQSLGAHHAAEIPFAMNTHEAGQKLSKSDKRLTAAMGQYWVNFARTGSPNMEGLPEWPQYDEVSDTWLELGNEIKSAPAYRARKLSILEDFINTRIDTISPPVDDSTPQASESGESSGE